MVLFEFDDPEHDNFIKWKHFPRYWPFVRGIHWSPVSSPHKGQWCRALMFSLICAWINASVNNGNAGDLRQHQAHYDVIVMRWQWWVLDRIIKSPESKSPQSGVTLCFQFVSAAAPSAAATTFFSHFKTFSFQRYLAQRIYKSGEMYWMTFLWPWPKVTAVTSISKNSLVCAIKWEPLIRSLQSMAALLP